MTRPESCSCRACPAFPNFCDGCNTSCNYAYCRADCGTCVVRCARRRDLDDWLSAIGGLALDVPLAPQPAFTLPSFFPQLLNGVEIPSAVARETALGVGIRRVLTPRGRVSHRACPRPYATYSLRVQWGLPERATLVCIGNEQDDYLESLWAAHAQGEDVWGHVRTLGFDAATSLNFSIYHDEPRMEHLISIKRAWLTIRHMQQASDLIPLPHLQWYQPLDLERQLRYVQARRFHTLTLNLQMTKRRGWSPIAAGLPTIQGQAPGLRFLIAGVVTLKKLAHLARQFPGASFTNTTVHYLAQRYTRLSRALDHATRLIKEPVDGHPDLILAENVSLYRDSLRVAGTPGPAAASPPAPGSTQGARIYAARQEIAGALRAYPGFDAERAMAAAERLAVDDEILAACLAWLRTGHLDRELRGSYPTWPCSDCVPDKPTLGRLLDDGLAPLDAFLRLADLAHLVGEEIQAFVGRAGY